MSRFKNIFILPIFIITLVLFSLFTPSASQAVDPLGTWSNTENLPNTLASHISFSSGNKISVVGGANTIVIPTNISSVTNANGTLQPWSSSGSSLSLFWHSSAIKDNILYILGGATFPPTVSLNTVYKGVINNQGIVTSWTLLTPLPKNLSIGASTVVGSRLYFAGGFTNGGNTNQDVYFVNINPDGTIGSWTLAGLLPEPMDGFGMVENENNLIIVGGRNLNKTYKSAIKADGTLVGWQETSSLPEAVHRSGVIKIGSTLLSVGGDNGGTFLDKIYYANINADATLGPWTLSANHLPQRVCCAAVASSGNYIYLTGGFNGNYLKTVYYTQINSNTSLPVPYYTQNSLPWGPSEYDSAASLGIPNPTMDRWGCAVTSAAMVLNYHGMTQFQDNTPINPGSLNQWLKTNNGYLTGSGTDGPYSYLSWPAISKLTEDLFEASKSAVKLVHNRATPSASTTILLNEDLTVEKFPDILWVKNASTSGHFVVAKGIANDTYTINDPEWNVPFLSSFNNNYMQVDRYVPSNTNFSYIVIVVNPSVEILVSDPLGRKIGKYIHNGQTEAFNEIPNASYSFQDPISNPDDEQNPEILGTGVNEFLLPEPTNGDYTIILSSMEDKNYTLNISSFENDSDNTVTTLSGSVGSNIDDTFNLNYSQTQPPEVQKVVTFQSIIDDINELRSIGEIKNFGTYISLLTKTNIASKMKNIKPEVTQKILMSILAELNAQRGKGLTEETYQILLSDVNYLKTHL